MTEAPERIWASGRNNGSWNDEPLDPEVEREYIRADDVNAMEAAAYEAAADLPIKRLAEGESIAPGNIAAAIRRLTPADARAALAKRDKRIKREALEEARGKVLSHPMRFAGQSEGVVRQALADAIGALIEANKGDEG